MIDIYNRVFGIVYLAAKGVDAQASVLDSYTSAPPTFPCVTVQEVNNITTEHPIGTRNTEKFARITYQIEVFTVGDKRRSESRGIMAAISDALVSLGFERDFMASTPNYADANVYRLTARFRTFADINNNTYRR